MPEQQGLCPAGEEGEWDSVERECLIVLMLDCLNVLMFECLNVGMCDCVKPIKNNYPWYFRAVSIMCLFISSQVVGINILGIDSASASSK